MFTSSRAHPSFGRRGRRRVGPALRDRAPKSVSALSEAPADERWSPRRTLAFVIAASAGLWGLIALIAYGGVLLLRH